MLLTVHDYQERMLIVNKRILVLLALIALVIPSQNYAQGQASPSSKRPVKRSQDFTTPSTSPEDEVSVARANHLEAKNAEQFLSFSSKDIGRVQHAGSVQKNQDSQCVFITGSGADIQGTADAFHYAYIPWADDGEIVARVVSIEETSIFAKAGVMFRESLEAGSRYAFMQIKANRGTEFQYRSQPNGGTTYTLTNGPKPEYWVRLIRQGDTFFGYRSADGQTWELESSAIVPMKSSLFVGLAVTSHNNSTITNAEFRDVRISSVFEAGVLSSTAETGVSGFIPLLTDVTFDPLTDDGKAPDSFYRDNDEFYTFRGDRYDINAAKAGPGYDEDEGKSPGDDSIVFRLTKEGYLHILGIPEDGKSQPFGYISTEDSYRNYHLSLEYKWGVRKFAPRNFAKRDSGLLYHVVGPDVVWTTDVETQIQEGDTGDFFFLGEDLPNSLKSSEGTVTVQKGTHIYEPGGETIDTGVGITKGQTVDSLNDWNRVEVIVEDDNVTVVVNGVVVNRARNLRRSNESFVIPLSEGKIALQAEGAEVFYRNVKIKPTHAVGGWHNYRVLLFQENGCPAQSAVDSMKAAEVAITALGAEHGFEVDTVTDSAGHFTDANLNQYSAVIWNNECGDVLDDEEQAAFEKYIEAGGGFVGLHGAASSEEDWQWYVDLVGARAVSCSSEQVATVRVDPEAAVGAGGSKLLHPAADALPQEWIRLDAWCSYEQDPRPNVNVLLNLKSSEDSHGSDAPSESEQPISWWHDFRGGRSFYTGLGHRPKTYCEPLYLEHLLGGIEYAAGTSRMAPQGAIILFDGTDTYEFEQAESGGAVGWQLDDDNNLLVIPGTGNIQTKQKFMDYRLHLEFKIPATLPGTPEQQRGNSGIYLHSSYELQILDSYGHPDFDAQHVGSIYSFKVADSNAALPAETWQVYDVEFKAPRFNNKGVKTTNARLTAFLNGVLIHDDVELLAATRGGQSEKPGPQSFFLQDHDPNSKLRFRNIWLVPVKQDLDRSNTIESVKIESTRQR